VPARVVGAKMLHHGSWLPRYSLPQNWPAGRLVRARVPGKYNARVSEQQAAMDE